MYLTCLILLWCGFCCGSAVGDNPGYRRRPANWVPIDDEKEAYSELLAKLQAIMLEQHARNKFLQQFEQLNKGLHPELYPKVEYSDYVVEENVASGISTTPPFAFKPSDPRYWNPETTSNNKVIQTSKISSASAAIDYDGDEIELAPDNGPIIKSSDGVPTYKLKAPMIPNPKQQGTTDNKQQEDTNLTQKASVIQKPLKIDDGIGVYVVAMIAGVSAAITVALIAIGLGWYTLRKKIKAAETVDYPAYGVTGPSKDLLYPSDKKFVQSVDMFHYQQQKQKKHSLENKSNGETNDGFSDLDGEFDMDDGDYTVYECPGFAPTGEMEVKNPLFADEPITIAQKHQPTTTDIDVQEVSEKPKTTAKAKKSSNKSISPNKEKSSKKK